MKSILELLFGYGKRIGLCLFVALLFTSMLLLSACSVVVPPPPIHTPFDSQGSLDTDVPIQPKSEPSNGGMITSTAGVAFRINDGQNPEEYRFYPLQEVAYKRQLETEQDIAALSEAYVGVVHLDFMLIHKSGSGNSWTLVYDPKLLVDYPKLIEDALPPSWFWQDFMIMNASKFDASHVDTIPVRILLDRNQYKITERRSLLTIYDSEQPSDLSSWVTAVLSETGGSPTSIARMAFSVESPDGLKRVGLYTDINRDGILIATDDPQFCVAGGVGEQSLYCQIYFWFSD